MLYVSESNPFIRKIFVWDVVNDSTISNKREFAYISTPNCYLDGMKVDEDGRLYSCGILGVVVFDTDGTHLDTIAVPGSTTNCNWGDEDGKTLYITSGNAVYKYTKLINGLYEPAKSIEKSFRLRKNYPNPFNPSTTIEFDISRTGFVELNIFDISGRKISTLVSNKLNKGTYNFRFNGLKLPSGVYFYQLVAGNYSEVRKMTLIK